MGGTPDHILFSIFNGIVLEVLSDELHGCSVLGLVVQRYIPDLVDDLIEEEDGDNLISCSLSSMATYYGRKSQKDLPLLPVPVNEMGVDPKERTVLA